MADKASWYYRSPQWSIRYSCECIAWSVTDRAATRGDRASFKVQIWKDSHLLLPVQLTSFGAKTKTYTTQLFRFLGSMLALIHLILALFQGAAACSVHILHNPTMGNTCNNITAAQPAWSKQQYQQRPDVTFPLLALSLSVHVHGSLPALLSSTVAGPSEVQMMMSMALKLQCGLLNPSPLYWQWTGV